jgi:RNA polymerase sigma-70 factor (ECF subfamily)
MSADTRLEELGVSGLGESGLGVSGLGGNPLKP